MARGLTAVHDRTNYVNLGLVELVEGGKDLVALGEVLTDNVDGAVGNRGDLGGINKGAHGRRIENDVLVLLLQRGNQLGKAARGDNVSRVGNARLGIEEEEVGLAGFDDSLVNRHLVGKDGVQATGMTEAQQVGKRTVTHVALDEKDALEDHARRDRERLSQLERAGIVSELSSMIAHELRQPVASLINYADGLSLYLGGKGHDPVIDEATREIGRQAERVSSIVERVRSYARQKEGLQREIDFCAVVKSAYSTFRSGAASSSVRVSADLVDAAPIEGDPLELELFVVNTLKNALHALQSGSVEHPEIRLRLKADLSVENNPRWVLEVEDNGLPLDDKKFAELSHPVTSEKFEGLGLGLSICRVIAERHRGRLTFRRAEPRGLVVSLSLPQVRTAEAA